jgi:hypothetical protein
LFQRRHAIARFLASRGIGEFVGSARNVALVSKHLYLQQDLQDARIGSCKKEDGAQDGEARWRGLEDSACLPMRREKRTGFRHAEGA